MNKNKLVKGLAIGLLAGVGVLTFAGCANVNVTQDQADSAFEAMEDARDFMDEVREDLNILTSKLTKEDAIAILKKAKYTGVMNLDNRYDNVTIKTSQICEGNEEVTYSYSGKLSNGKQFVKYEDDTYGIFVQEENMEFTQYHFHEDSDETSEWRKVSFSDITDNGSGSGLSADDLKHSIVNEFACKDRISLEEFSQDDITFVRINEKGNYEIELCYEEKGEPANMTYQQTFYFNTIEIDSEFRVVKISKKSYSRDIYHDGTISISDKQVYSVTISYDYSKVTDTVVAEVEAKIAEIEASTAQN